MKISIKFLISFYLILVVLLYLFPFSSSISLNNYSVSVFRADHVLHSLVFIPLPFLILFYSKNSRFVLLKSILYSLLISVFYELIHLVIPYRSFTIIDLFSNVIGVLIGSLILVIYCFFKK